MGDLKPLGSEKLQGDDKLKRILELTYFNQPKKTKSTNKAEIVKESVSGGVYGIVKEKDGYYVKQGLNESSLDYIGGLFMKNKNRFSSYAEALKRMNLLSGQSNLQEATKYILKPKSQEQESSVPASEPTPTPAEPAPSAEPIPDTSMDTTTPDAGDESKRSDYMAEVQKYAGKLGQELRDQHQRMESDDIKYVLNMVISAVDLDKLDLEDLEEIGKKFSRDEEDSTDTETPEEPSVDDVPNEPADTEAPESDLGETMSKLDEFIKMGAPSQEDEISLEKYTDIDEEDDLKEIDLEEIKSEINHRIGETLKKYFNK